MNEHNKETQDSQNKQVVTSGEKKVGGQDKMAMGLRDINLYVLNQ